MVGYTEGYLRLHLAPKYVSPVPPGTPFGCFLVPRTHCTGTFLFDVPVRTLLGVILGPGVANVQPSGASNGGQNDPKGGQKDTLGSI